MVCHDPDRQWFPQRTVDFAAMEEASANRMYDALHAEDTGRVFHDGTFRNWSKVRDRAHPFHYRDGVTIWVAETDLNPGDLFTTRHDADPRGGEHGSP